MTGNMLANSFPAGDGDITVTSTRIYESQPVTLVFKQVSIDKVGDGVLKNDITAIIRCNVISPKIETTFGSQMFTTQNLTKLKPTFLTLTSKTIVDSQKIAKIHKVRILYL